MARLSMTLALIALNFLLLLVLFAPYQEGGKRFTNPLSRRSQKGKIHIVFTASPPYTIGLWALVNSTLTTSNPDTLPRIHYHIVSQDSQQSSSVVKGIKERFGSRVEGKISGYASDSLADQRLNGIKVWAGYREDTLSKPIVFARYIIPALIPLNIDRVIYLDQDVLVKSDLSELWNVDLEGYPLGAGRLCRDSALWKKQLLMKQPQIAQHSFDADTCTLNNGVIVYDLVAWRAASPSYTDLLFDWSIANSATKLYSLGSQPPFNLVFYQNYKVLDDKWNLMDIAGLNEETEYGHGLPWTRSTEEVDAAAILHWNGVVKPWTCDGEGPYAEQWINYFPDFRQHLPTPTAEEQEYTKSICSRLVLTTPPVSPSVEQFTVVIVSFARVDTLVVALRLLNRSPFVKEVIVAWNNQVDPCPVELEKLPWVRCIQQEANLVHNRFLIWPQVTTEAVLHYDDDLLANLSELAAAFQLWRHHRDQIVGFEPRVIVCDSDERQSGAVTAVATSPAPNLELFAPELETGCKYRFKLTRGYFDVVIGKLFFVHKKYMEEYFDHPAPVALSTTSSCEDIAMSFLVAYSTTPPSPEPRAPILFKSNLTEIHSKVYAGLSQGIASTVWRESRSSCVQELLHIFENGRPGRQESYYTYDGVRGRTYKLRVKDSLSEGWCSDVFGSRVCRQP